MEALFENRNPKAFAKLFKEGQEEWGEPTEFLRQASEFLAFRSYEKYYGDLVPHAFFGLTCASAALPLFPEERKWWPCVQQGWLAANERRRQPWSGASQEAINGKSDDEGWLDFRGSYDVGDAQRCYALAKGFLKDESSRETFRVRSLTMALDDTAQGGIKAIHLSKAWEMAEQLEWKQAHRILFPALHLLTVAPHETELSESVKVKTIPAFEGTESSLAQDVFDQVEKTILFGETLQEALDGVSTLDRAGLSVPACMDTLSLIAAQALNNSQMGRWSPALRAFLYTDVCRQWAQRMPASSQGYAVMMAAALIHQASSRSRKGDRNRTIIQLSDSVAPADAFNTLRSLVSHSDPYASADAVRSILSMDDDGEEELFQVLVTLAAKNDGRSATGYDLLLVETAVRSYQASQSPVRDRLLTACGFFLGRVLKNYELFGAYGVK